MSISRPILRDDSFPNRGTSTAGRCRMGGSSSARFHGAAVASLWFISIVLALFTIRASAAQPSLEITPDEATIGDHISVRLTVPGAAPGDIDWPQFSERLGDFEILNVDTASAKEARKQGGAFLEWTVAAYDTGSFSTGEIKLTVAGEEVLLEPGEVLVHSVISDTTDREFAPLKAQVELPYTFRDFAEDAWPWALGVLVLAALAYLVYRLIRRHREPKWAGRYEKPLPPPYDEAIAALKKLKKDNPLARGDMKEYVSRLTEILKRLLERVHGDPVREMTTWEVRRWTEENRVKGDTRVLLELLSDADLVKFAKGMVDGDRCSRMFTEAEEFVAAYKPVPVEEGAPGNGSEGSGGREAKEERR